MEVLKHMWRIHLGDGPLTRYFRFDYDCSLIIINNTRIAPRRNVLLVKQICAPLIHMCHHSPMVLGRPVMID